MKRTLICLIILLPIAVPVNARRSADGSIELTIYPAKAGELEQKYRLMIKAEDQIDADAVPLYEKAIKSIPKDFNQERIRELWEAGDLNKADIAREVGYPRQTVSACIKGNLENVGGGGDVLP